MALEAGRRSAGGPSRRAAQGDAAGALRARTSRAGLHTRACPLHLSA